MINNVFEKDKIKTINDEEIFIPDFQRKVVWKPAQQRYLIESILLGFPIPNLFFSVSKREDNSEKWSLIDGQQRWTSISKYLNDEFKMQWSKSTKNTIFKAAADDVRDVMENTENKLFSELDPKYKNIIENYNLFYIKANDGHITGNSVFDRELFNRINTVSKTLNSQELRKSKFYSANMNSLYSKASDDFSKLLIDKRVVTKSQVERSVDVELLLIIMIMHETNQVIDSKPGLLDEFSQKMMTIPEEEFTERMEVIFKNISTTLKTIQFSNKIFGKYYFEIIYYTLFISKKVDNVLKINDFITWITADRNEEIRYNFQPTHTKSSISKNESIDIMIKKINGQ